MYNDVTNKKIRSPKFIFVLSIFSRIAKSRNVILKPCPIKGCITCKASPNKSILSL